MIELAVRHYTQGGYVLDADMILAALTAGVAAGATATGSSIVTDAYNGLKTVVRRKLAAAGQPADVIEGTVANDEARQALNAAAIPGDPEVAAAYQQLIAVRDQSTHSTVINSGTVHGAAGNFHAPVTIHNAPLGRDSRDPQ